MIDAVLSRLQGVRQERPSQWQAKCPVHDDRLASLSVGLGGDGKVLVHCHAGCKYTQILSALGLESSDLGPAGSGPHRRSTHRDNAGAKDAATFKSAEDAGQALARKHGRQAGAWTYHDQEGREIFRILRFERDGIKTYRPLHRVNDGWMLGDPPGKLPLYRLPTLDGARRVFILEGEKCADLAAGLGLAATTSAHGCQSAKNTDFSPLVGREVVILPDNDRAGQQYAGVVQKLLAELDPRPTVRVLTLPELPDKGDLEQFIEQRDTRTNEEIVAEIEALVAAIQPVALRAHTPGSEPRAPRETQATALVRIASGAELFHDPGGEPWATIRVGSHRETHPVRSRAFRRWSSGQFHAESDKTPGAQALSDASTVIEGMAVFEGPELLVYTRVAGDDAHCIIDLGDAAWRAIEIDARGWRIVSDPPVRFRRAKGLLALPVPETGGSLDELRGFVNVADEDDGRLMIAWLTACFRPVGPYPLLVLTAEHGGAKSTTTRLLRQLIDPNKADLRSEPREVRDSMLTVINAWLLALDNLSRLQPWLSDALCRLSTGGGFATREFYTDFDEVVFDAMRPVIVNGIDHLATRGDLADRCLNLHLPTIRPSRRRTEHEFWGAANDAKPRMLGAVLDTVAGALRVLPDVDLSAAPRMADFARWGVAVERALGWPDGAFLRAYNRNRATVNEAAIESAAAVAAACAAVDGQSGGTWSGTFKELLDLIEKEADERARRDRHWPQSPRKLSGMMRRLAPNLRATGWVVELPDERERRGRKRERIVTLRRVGSADDVADGMADDTPIPRRDRPHMLPAEAPKPAEVTRSADDADDVDGIAPYICSANPTKTEVDSGDGSTSHDADEKKYGQDRSHRPNRPPVLAATDLLDDDGVEI